MEKEFYTLKEVAEVLSVSYMTVYRWVQKGSLRAYQVGKQYRVDAGSLQNFIEKGDTLNFKNVSQSLTEFIGTGMMDYSYMGGRNFPIDLSLAVNPLGCSNKVVSYAENAAINFTNYSEVVSDSVRKKIGEVYGFNADEILIGSGISELLHLSYITFMNPLEGVVMPEISFPPFEFLAILAHGKPNFIPMQKNFDLDYDAVSGVITHRTKMLVLCNPNNPTGKQLDKEKTESLFEEYKDIIFVIDEANIDFGGESFLELVKEYDNLLVLRSFSKGFGLAGLRIGFMFGNKDLIYALMRRQTPFSVNVFAQKYALVALDDMEFLGRTKEYTQQERRYLEEELGKLGYSYVQSDANYLLVDVTANSKFSASKEALEELNKKGVNAVNGEDFRGLGEKYIRLSPRTHDTNKAFIDILSGF